MLKIRVTAAKGLNLPQGGEWCISYGALGNSDTTVVSVPAPIQEALTTNPTPASRIASSPPTAVVKAAGANRDSVQRRQVWWLPYLVLEFDKNEVLVDALGGDLASPVWMYSATFDVSRISEISATVYLRTKEPHAEGGAKFNGEGEGEDMGNSDLCLGSIRFTPNLDSLVSMDDVLEVDLWSCTDAEFRG